MMKYVDVFPQSSLDQIYEYGMTEMKKLKEKKTLKESREK